VIDQVVGAVALIVIGLGLIYCVGTVLFGLHGFRREQTPVGVPSRHSYGEDQGGETEPEGYHVYFLIAALNEQEVIGRTVASLLTRSASAHVIVVDDGSDDQTGPIARSCGDRVITLRRELPEARQGKGAALNFGFATLVSHVRQRRLDRARVVVCVMDADGRLSADALRHVVPLFDDPRVGGAQLGVRIRNRGSFLTTIQDFEFWGISAVAQIGRIHTGSVSLGGNGQFTRLSALLQVGSQPWSDSLTEDLDLTISLLTAGWRLTSTVHASVEQQAVDNLPRLIRQRTRWFQGHMLCGRRLPGIWTSPRMTHAAVLELSLYLAMPWLLILWSVLFHVGLLETARAALSASAGDVGVLEGVARVVTCALLTFGPGITLVLLYVRRCGDVGLQRAIVLGHAVIFVQYLTYAAAWGALRRIVRGERTWVKTQREVEPAAATAALP